MSDEDSETDWDDDETAPIATQELAQQVADFETRVAENLSSLADQVGVIARRVDDVLLAVQGRASGEAADTSNTSAHPEPVAPVGDGMQKADEMTPVAHADTATAAAPEDPGSLPAGAVADNAANAALDMPPGPHAAAIAEKRAQSLQSADGVGGLAARL